MRQYSWIVALVALIAVVAVTAGALPDRYSDPGAAEHGDHNAHVQSAFAQAACWPVSVLMGALPGQPQAIWCYDPMETGPTTFRRGANSWEDDFDHGLSMAELGAGYRTFDFGSIGQTRHWRHSNHWMVDVAGSDQDGAPPWNFGGTMLRPDQSFRAENGRLVIEATVAAGVVEYQGVAWPELVITTADHPTQMRSNGTYVYEAFPNHTTLGCRLQADGSPTCALLDDSAGGDSSARVAEVSHFQTGNTAGSTYSDQYATKFGGHPSSVPNAFRFCQGTDPDTNCRDEFRWEVREDRLTLYVNGTKYMEHGGAGPVIREHMRRLLTQPVYVYFGGFLFKPDAEAVRFHWDRIAVNSAGGSSTPPPAASPSPSPSPSPTAPPSPSPTAVPSPSPTAKPSTPTAIPISTAPGATVTVTFDDKSGQNQSLNGQYPSNVIDWGTGIWYHAGPWGKFSTKSVSFNGPNSTSQTFSFVTPRQLVSLKAYNGGSGSSTVRLKCAGKPDRTVTVAAGKLVTISTGWSGTCSTVTVQSSNGWDTNFDDLVVAS